MQAVICKREYDPDCSDLFEELKSQGIQYWIIENLQQLEETLPVLDQDKPFLMYQNSQWRIDQPAAILQWHGEHTEFDWIAFLNDEEEQTGISFMPQQAIVFRDTVITKSAVRDEDVWPFLLKTYGDDPLRVRWKKPDVSPPHIFVLAHNRPEYLKLTLNSLLYSLDPHVPVHVFLNGEHEGVRQVALEAAEKHVQVDAIQIPTNVHHSAVNLAIQWSQPEHFIIWEDDFILPPVAKNLFPHWPYQFVSRLQHFDLVGWAPITENIPKWSSRLGNLFPRKDYSFGDWYESGTERYDPWIESTKKPLLLGQAVAMSREFWNRCDKRSPWFVPLDTELHSAAKSYCVPGLRGYHIGWNFRMDGYPKNPAQTPNLIHTITSLKTGRQETLRLDAI